MSGRGEEPRLFCRNVRSSFRRRQEMKAGTGGSWTGKPDLLETDQAEHLGQ